MNLCYCLAEEVNEENAPQLLLRLQNCKHLDYKEEYLNTIEVNLEKDLLEIAEESKVNASKFNVEKDLIGEAISYTLFSIL